MAKKADTPAQAAEVRGERFIQKAASYFSDQGWRVTTRHSKHGFEHDIYGERGTTPEETEYLVAECKDKDTISAQDVEHFANKVSDFAKGLPPSLFGQPEVIAYFCVTGVVSGEASAAARSYNPPVLFRQFR